MSGHDPKVMGALAESLIWPAIDLVGLVKGGGDRDEIGVLLSGLTDEQRWAFPVILAAMVDDERTPDELLSWVTFSEYGRPYQAPRSVTPRWRVEATCGSEEALRRHDVLGEDCETCTASAVARSERGTERKRRSRQAAREAA